MTPDDGLLSQDEIDALTAGLLGGGGDDDGGDSGGGDDGSSGDDPQLARPALKLISEQSSSVLSTVLSKEVDLRLDNVTSGEIDVIKGSFPMGGLVVKNRFSSDVSGFLYFLVSKKMTAVLADLMMMGDGQVEFEEDHKDALAEMINQIMGSAVTSFGSEMGLKLEIGQAEIVEMNVDDPTFPVDGTAMGTLEFKVDGFDSEQAYWIGDEDFVASFRSDVGEEAVAIDTGLDMSAPGGGGGDMGPGNSEPVLSGGGEGGGFFSTGNKALDLLLDIEMPLTIELGRTELSLKRILDLGPGSIVEMDRLFGEPVDLLINGKVVARGEVVVVDENFGIRVVSLVSPEERIQMLK